MTRQTPPPLGNRKNKSKSIKKGNPPFLRLLPLLIIVAALTFSLRINDLRYVFTNDSPVSQPNSGLQAQQVEEETAEARTDPANADAANTDTNTDMSDKKNKDATPPPLISGKKGDMSETEKDLLNRLQERRLNLDEREASSDRRDALLKAGEEQIERKLTEMKSLQSTIQGLLRQYDEQEETKMRSLVKIYESMKPKDAARIFEQLDMAILLEVIERMKEQKVAPILASMDPSRARLLTSELAQRRQIPLPKGAASR